MNSKLYASLLLVVFLGCQKKEIEKTYTPRVLTANESFNGYQQKEGDSLAIYDLVDTAGAGAKTADGEVKTTFRVKFGDTIVSIQSSPSDKNITADRFASAQFLNTQKTSLLVQLADNSGLVAPFYLIALNQNKLEVVSLFRPSKGAEDKRFTKGMNRIGRSGYLINNDFFITTVNAKAYLITRQNAEERIQGFHFMNSRDKHTLVFLTGSSLYQVHYPTGRVFTQPLSPKAPKEPSAIYGWIQNNFNWKKDERGIFFLKENADENRVIDISDFGKKGGA